jgi:hypothetical protein
MRAIIGRLRPFASLPSHSGWNDATRPWREAVSDRQVVLRRGRRVGWWVEGRSAGGRLFMKTWWPTKGLARAVARLVGGRGDPGGAG